MTTPLNRQNAASRARLAQALLGLFVIGGGGALAVGLHVGPRAQAPESDKIPVPVVDLGLKNGPGAKGASTDTAGLAERMNLVANAPKPEIVVAQETTAKGGTVIETQPPPPPPPVRYLGGVMGSKAMALVSDNGKQKFVAVGDTLGGGTVESITDTQINIKGDSPHTIELATRTGEVLTHGRAANGQQASISRPGQPSQPNQVAASLSKAIVQTQGGAAGINGEQIPPVPDYIRPEQRGRYEQLREELRSTRPPGSEAELSELTSKMLSSEDPKVGATMEKMKNIKGKQP
jgi:hypothetical protein